jgi:hypothetical protein
LGSQQDRWNLRGKVRLSSLDIHYLWPSSLVVGQNLERKGSKKKQNLYVVSPTKQSNLLGRLCRKEMFRVLGPVYFVMEQKELLYTFSSSVHIPNMWLHYLVAMHQLIQCLRKDGKQVRIPSQTFSQTLLPKPLSTQLLLVVSRFRPSSYSSL